MGYRVSSSDYYILWMSQSSKSSKASSRRRALGCESPLGYRVHQDSMLHKPIEQLSATARGSTIEAKCKLIQVIIQVLVTDRPLVGTHEPSLEK